MPGYPSRIAVLRSAWRAGRWAQYELFVAELPEALRAHIPSAGAAPAHTAYTRAAAGAPPQNFIRYSLIAPDRADLVRVAYDSPALTVGSPGFAPYRAEEFAVATRKLIELVLPGKQEETGSIRAAGLRGMISWWQTIAVAAYFLLPLWLAWYAYELYGNSAFLIGTEAAVVLLGPALVAIGLAIRRGRSLPFYGAILLPATRRIS